MELFEKLYSNMNKLILSFLGQLRRHSPCKRQLFCTVVTLFMLLKVVPEVFEFVIVVDDLETVFECIPQLALHILNSIKSVNCAHHVIKRLKLLNRIDEDWRTWGREREVVILHEYAETGRKMAFAYTGAIYSTGIIFMTQPILPKIIDVLLYNGTEIGEFPFPVYYYRLDQQKYYFYIIGYTYVCVSMIIVITIAGDTMFIVYVQHGCGIFAALGRKLMQIGENERTIDGRDMDFEILAICIDRHNDAIEFAKLIESTYSGCFFFVVGFNMLIMSVTGLQIITRTNDPQDTIRFVAFVGAQMIHLFIESYISQILMDHSASIRDYIHNGKWYKTSLKCQKLLNLMTMRCNVPCKLTAGKMCVMSVETFGVVVKTSMSYFTLLRSMQ